MIARQHIALSKGSTRDTRSLTALDPRYFLVDELSFEEMIGMIAQLAGSINYYHRSEDDIKGNWQPFFFRDETVVMAMVLNYDLKAFADEFFRLLNSIKSAYPASARLAALRATAQYLIGQAQIINGWYDELNQSVTATHLVDELSNMIAQKLRPHLQYLIRLALTVERMEQNENRFDNRYTPLFGKLWEADRNIDIYQWEENTNERIDAETDRLHNSYYDFSDSIFHLGKMSRNQLEDSMNSSRHPPQIALMLVFLKLYEKNRDKLNELTGRHLDHYYFEILKIVPKRVTPDRVNVVFVPAAHIGDYLVPAQTAIAAGKDDKGNDVFFETTENLLVNRAAISEIKTIFAGKHPDIYTGTKQLLVTKIHAADVVDATHDTRDFLSWPTFGEFEIFRRDNYNRQRTAEIGFAVASPILQLQQGDREVVIDFEFTAQSFAVLALLVEEVKATEKTTLAAAFHKIFFQSFHLHVTTEDGWAPLENYMVTSPFINGEPLTSLAFHINISNAFKPVINYSPELHGTDPRYQFDTRWPVIKISIAADSAFYPYSFVSDLVIEKINIAVDVKGLRNVSLVNQDGPLNASQPFTPFGAVPVKGSYLLLGQKEVFYKSLDHLSITIQWLGLPETKYGFTEYYVGYPDKVVNESFQCKFSILNNYRWSPARDAQQNVVLFESKDPFSRIPDYGIKPVTDINYIDIGKIKLPWLFEDASTPLSYSTELQRGFVKLELSDPPMAFGSEAYPRLLSDSIMNKASNKPYIEPNKPYVPVINDIRIDYSSSLVINFSNYSKEEKLQGEFYHFNPFGHNEMSPVVSSERLTLLPQFDSEGALFLGITNLDAPQTLSLYFHLHENPGGMINYHKPVVKWSYLASNEWKPLPQSRVLKDTTESFIKSGIIVLELPDSITTDNTSMPAGLAWIRAEVPTGTQHTSFTVNIYSQSATAIRQVIDPFSSAASLPPATVSGLKSKVPEIAAVLQPAPSFGGHSGEQDGQIYTRVSERLRHKKRAITPHDYELLVLERFHSIYKVRCIINSTREVHGGNIRLIVLPDVTRSNAINPNEPRASTWLLNEIGDYLRKHAPVFARIEVVNPDFEHVRVSCRILFKKGCNNGYYIQSLNDEIKRYLTPWLMMDGYRPYEFGAPMNKHNILAFIESLPYVEVVKGFSVNLVTHRGNEYHLTTFNSTHEEEGMIYPSTPWSILISAESHSIKAVEDTDGVEMMETGIGYLSIGTDFIVNKK